MATRIVTGLILAAGAILLLTLAPPWATEILVVIAALLVADEFFRISLGADGVVARYVGDLAVAALVVVAWLAPGYVLPVMIGAPALLLCVVLFSRAPVEAMGPRAASLVCGFFYLGGALVTLAWLAGGPSGPMTVLALFAAVFAGDTGAFFSGKFLGKNSEKLYAKISPKKTRIGSYGGAVASALGFVLINSVGALGHPPLTAALLGLLCGLTGQVGDLAESLFKRAYGVKDSGALLPGHGGVWDRIDGVLFASPFLWLALRYAV